jgi:hypothetical protein
MIRFVSIFKDSSSPSAFLQNTYELNLLNAETAKIKEVSRLTTRAKMLHINCPFCFREAIAAKIEKQSTRGVPQITTGQRAPNFVPPGSWESIVVMIDAFTRLTTTAQ